MGLFDWLFGDADQDEFGDSYRAYTERADHIRQAYGWTLPEPPPPGGGNWLELGRYDDQEPGW
jgi:hypothetical protein